MNGLAQFRRLTRNLAATAAGQALGTVLNLIAVVTVARQLGVEGYGQYAYVLAFVGVFQLFVMAGVGHIVTREVAVNPANGRRIVGAAQSLVSLLAIVVCGIVAATASNELRGAFYLATLGVVAAMQAMVLGGFFRALEEMVVTSTGLVLQKTALVGFVLVSAALDLGLQGMCAAFAVASASLWLFYAVTMIRRHFWPGLRFDPTLWILLLRDGLPMGGAAILRKTSGRVDVLILTALGSHAAAGHFSAGYKIVEALGVVATTLAQVIFPLLSRTAHSGAMFSDVVAVSVRYLLFAGLPLAVILGGSAAWVVTFVYGPAFAPAADALALLSVACATVFITALYPFLFAALHAQQQYIIAAAAGLLVNVLVDIVLIPRLSHVGAAIGTVCAEVTFLALGALFLRRHLTGLSLVSMTWRPLAAGLAMAATVVLASGGGAGTFVAGLVAATILYVVLLIVLGAVRPSEVALIRGEWQYWAGVRGRREDPVRQTT